MNLHILITCRKPDLLRASTLVFDTLRVGFPTANVVPLINGICDAECHKAVREAMAKAKVENDEEGLVYGEFQTIHHEWIWNLIERNTEPFWICDTDLIFWDKVEHWDYAGCAMAGRYIPAFHDQYSKCDTQPRLHTSLLYLDPTRIKAAIKQFLEQFPNDEFTPWPNFVYPLCIPTGHWKHVFFDTCSLLYQVVGPRCRVFEEEQLNAYDHLNFGTISDIVAPHYPTEHFREAHFAIFENPSLARGAWRKQEEFYRRHPVA